MNNTRILSELSNICNSTLQYLEKTRQHLPQRQQNEIDTIINAIKSLQVIIKEEPPAAAIETLQAALDKPDMKLALSSSTDSAIQKFLQTMTYLLKTAIEIGSNPHKEKDKSMQPYQPQFFKTSSTLAKKTTTPKSNEPESETPSPPLTPMP